ncbi:hypothetical protein [Nocardioides sp.]|uniref:hypothetical protein n=1 Tax=Nocardioides sp. TaxID=35761 RepID=UPI002732512A|nr:hypothetical protein [Nocardioides sp.]MDP3894558.1 hypothetical protein [Nocardioides sp.]
MASIKVGERLRGSACTTEVVVVRAPEGEVELTCCGAPLGADVATADGPGEPGESVLIGKRYVNDALGLELLCVKGGRGPIVANQVTLTIKTSKPLPASD